MASMNAQLWTNTQIRQIILPHFFSVAVLPGPEKIEIKCFRRDRGKVDFSWEETLQTKKVKFSELFHHFYSYNGSH